MMDELAVILPEVASYETGLLDFLVRGELSVAVSRQIAVSAKGLGAGSLEILVEDDRGVRTQLAHQDTAAGAEQLAQVGAPAAGTRVIAVFRGTDAAGEPIVAVGAAPLGGK